MKKHVMVFGLLVFCWPLTAVAAPDEAYSDVIIANVEMLVPDELSYTVNIPSPFGKVLIRIEQAQGEFQRIQMNWDEGSASYESADLPVKLQGIDNFQISYRHNVDDPSEIIYVSAVAEYGESRAFVEDGDYLVVRNLMFFRVFPDGRIEPEINDLLQEFQERKERRMRREQREREDLLEGAE